MKLFFLFLTTLYLFLSVPIGKLAVKKGKKPKKVMLTQISLFAILCIFSFISPLIAHAEGSSSANLNTGVNNGIALIASALAIGLSGIGAGIAVAATGPAAIGATAENEKMFGKSLIFIAMGEAIALYGVAVSMIILFTKT